MSVPILVDTGPIVALLSRNDQHFDRCLQAAEQVGFPLLTCWPVLAEATHLIHRNGGELRDVLEWVKQGRLELLGLDRTDLLAIDKILGRYSDQGFDLADAALMWLAEREGIEKVFTIDSADFATFRTAEGRASTLIV